MYAAWTHLHPLDTGPPLTPRELRLTDENVVGCYALVSLEWDMPLSSDEQRLYTSPQRFALRRDPETSTPTVETRSRPQWRFTHWQITDGGDLVVAWGSGLVGVTYTVRRRSIDDHLYGRAGAWTDSPGVILPRGSVELRPVSC